MKTFATLPASIQQAIADMLAKEESDNWVQHAIPLHEKYMGRKSNFGKVTLKSRHDALAYLGLRIPATYAQIYGALDQIKELMPSWKPQSLLDLGSGPGTASWAAKNIWPSIVETTAIDQYFDFLTIGKHLQKSAQMDIAMDWKQADVKKGVTTLDKQFDVVIIANVLNELSSAAADKVIGQAFDLCKNLLVIIEPGTPTGSSIIENASRKLSKAGKLLAPYIQNTFIHTTDYYIHFSQRFIRPEFQRRIRQYMRDTSSMASDWEDAKYTYTVISKIEPELQPWGRCIGLVQTQKGFVEFPLLTKNRIQTVKVMKRNHQQYAFAKDLKWGQTIKEESLL